MSKRLGVVIALPLFAVSGLAGPAVSAAEDNTTENIETVISTEEVTEKVYNEDIGEYVTFTGTKTTSLLTGTGDVSATTANTMSGCRVTEWAGNPKMARGSSAPYTEYVAASGYKTLSSACNRSYISMSLKECRWVGCSYHPTRDDDSGYVYPGGTKWLNVSYTCGDSREYYALSGLYQYGSSDRVRLCG